jgi:5-methylcytosine-specific restriction endonuclease McrA
MATKGLSEDGSTRSWRRKRAAKVTAARKAGTYKCAVCGRTRNLQLDHKRSRRKGGTDADGNLGKFYCPKHNPGTGRPRKGT